MPIQCTCPQCGKTFTRKPSKARAAKYCSKACRYAPQVGVPRGDGTIAITIKDGQIAIIDEADAETVLARRWYVSGGYAASGSRTLGTFIFMHRLIMGPDAPEIDHRNRKRLDNRRSNLREATSSQNKANRGPSANNTSGYKGVYRDGSRWYSQIYRDKQWRYLGRYGTREEAARAYDAAALEMFGEFAHLNFPSSEHYA